MADATWAGDYGVNLIKDDGRPKAETKRVDICNFMITEPVDHRLHVILPHPAYT